MNTLHDSKWGWPWFSIHSTVGRQEYAMVGIALAILKYAIEWIAVYVWTGQFYGPLSFVNPWLSSKAPFLADAPASGIAWFAFTLPFVWVAIAMSIRRAADIGLSPWWGMSMLVPLFNLVVMLVFALLPSRLLESSPEDQASADQVRSAFQPPAADCQVPEDVSVEPSRGGGVAFLLSVSVGTIVQSVIGAVSVWIFESYGFVLFFASPVVAGSVTGFLFNLGMRRGLWATTGVVLVMNLTAFAAMLGLGLDGAICLIMAYPLLGTLSVMGGWIGGAIAVAGLRPGVREHRGMVGMTVLIPLTLLLEPLEPDSTLHAVTTSVDIAAAPEVVWQQVVSFPEIEEPLPWYFRIGIAAPMRARIDGQGIGAVRHCEFTTGSFVEPITAWDPPRRLAFDVESQPEPMQEWSPYVDLHPHHLDTGFLSRKGEFSLEPLPTGGTRLHGTTWYEINVRPRLYWKSWSDAVVHAVHRRVLDHIARQSEDQ